MKAILPVAVLAAVLAAGPGARFASGIATQPHAIGPFQVPGGLLSGGRVYEWPATRDGTITGLVWNASTAGIGTSMTYRVLVGGVEACAITTTCATTAMQTAACSAQFIAGEALRLEVKTDDCLVGNPAGGIMLVGE